eukprot:scaffold30473_cov150-Skeletonema_dohrnii-CCMP3373.AAC.3
MDPPPVPSVMLRLRGEWSLVDLKISNGSSLVGDTYLGRVLEISEHRIFNVNVSRRVDQHSSDISAVGWCIGEEVGACLLGIKSLDHNHTRQRNSNSKRSKPSKLFEIRWNATRSFYFITSPPHSKTPLCNPHNNYPETHWKLVCLNGGWNDMYGQQEHGEN